MKRINRLVSPMSECTGVNFWVSVSNIIFNVGAVSLCIVMIRAIRRSKKTEELEAARRAEIEMGFRQGLLDKFEGYVGEYKTKIAADRNRVL